MKIRTIITTTVLILVLITISTTTAAAISCDCGDICVNQSGWWRDGGAFIASSTPIQAAVNAATAGETICVAAGSYNENVVIMTPHLTLKGEGADLVTVTAASSSDHVFEVTRTWVNISGFTVTGATGKHEAGIYLDGDYCNISENNASNNDDGIRLGYSSNDNTLANNNASNNDIGIFISLSTYNTLANNNASNNDIGIWMYDSSNNTLTGNTVHSNNNYGIWMDHSSNSTLTSNKMSENARNFGVHGPDCIEYAEYTEYAQNIDTSNTVDGKPIYYWVDQKDRQIPSDAGFVGVVNGTNITVRDLTLTNNRYGVLFVNIENSRIENVTASNNDYGIQLGFSSNNTLTSNTASNNRNGIRLDASRYNTLVNNTLANNSDGIVLVSSIMDSSSDNLLYNNYFNNTNNNVYSDSSNQWNITKTAGTNIIGGSYLGGNYWSDYAGVDNTGDGLGDTLLPYNSEIPYGGDFHPLTTASAPTPICNCTCGNICVNQSGWWRDGGALNASGTPIQAAINAATAGETICVAAGSYTENVDITTAHLTLAGEGADVVTVRAANADDHVFEVTADWVNICGFVVTGATGNYKAGIHLDNADRCSILENNVSDNDYGIFIGDSNNNTFYHNNLINNIKNAYDTGTNQWNSGSEGNYYFDYVGIDADGDGIGDIPYNISGGTGTQDRYPLMQLWNERGSEFISIGSANASLNSTITIPVSVANVTNISRISFDLLYNSSVVTVSSVSANESFTGSSITPNIDNVNGITSIVLTNSNLISALAETPVIDIAFNITGGSGSSTSLDLQNVEFRDSEFNPYTPAIVVDGMITVGIKGDFNGNDRVDIGDVAKVAFMVAGKVPEDLNADFNNNGRVDIGDAAKIAFYLARKVSEL